MLHNSNNTTTTGTVQGFRKLGGTIICYVQPSRPIETYPEEKIQQLYEQYNRCQNKQDRKVIRQQHNELALQLNNQYGRKYYLFI